MASRFFRGFGWRLLKSFCWCGAIIIPLTGAEMAGVVGNWTFFIPFLIAGILLGWMGTRVSRHMKRLSI